MKSPIGLQLRRGLFVTGFAEQLGHLGVVCADQRFDRRRVDVGGVGDHRIRSHDALLRVDHAIAGRVDEEPEAVEDVVGSGHAFEELGEPFRCSAQVGEEPEEHRDVVSNAAVRLHAGVREAAVEELALGEHERRFLWRAARDRSATCQPPDTIRWSESTSKGARMGERESNPSLSPACGL